MIGELYWTSDKNMLLLENLETHETTRFDQISRSFLRKMDQKMALDYPDQYAELKELFPDPEMYYGRTFQFCACNFSERDGIPDIDEDFNFNVERVACPVRHLCKLSTCVPKLSSKLTDIEKSIIRLFPENDEEEIAEKLFKSRATIHNHITRIYQKLDMSGKKASKQLVSFAHKNNLT